MNTKDQVRSTEEAISTERALDLALEALGQLWLFGDEAAVIANPAITAIKQARSAPVEPAIKQGWDVDTLLDKPAAQRQWTGLTDEERNKIRFDYLDYDERARAIEAKLKEKNT